jgi:hypothetical protein
MEFPIAEKAAFENLVELAPCPPAPRSSGSSVEIVQEASSSQRNHGKCQSGWGQLHEDVRVTLTSGLAWAGEQFIPTLWTRPLSSQPSATHAVSLASLAFSEPCTLASPLPDQLPALPATENSTLPSGSQCLPLFTFAF